MAYLLADRDAAITEWMEDPDCDRQLLFNTYRQFRRINKMLSGWQHLYRRHIRPVLQSHAPCNLLDIGFGGGDLPLAIHQWAVQDGYQLNITAIDTDERAIEFVNSEYTHIPDSIEFHQASLDQLFDKQQQFDIIISNHLLHHFSETDLYELANQSEQLSSRLVLFNDLERRDLAYLLFNTIIAPFFRHSFAARDGRRSMRRSFTLSELRAIMPERWSIYRQFPFRLIATYRNGP